MWTDTVGFLLKQKNRRRYPCGLYLCPVPSGPFIPSVTFLTNTPIPSLLYHSNPPPSSFMTTDTHAQQAFRSEPRNLTVRMGATAVLRCEVLRASGTVQWVKDGLLLGPQRSLPGFSRYSMIGNPKRGKQTQGTVCSVLDFLCTDPN